MECPDGSFVGRDPDNNCGFFPCPSQSGCSADVYECSDGSFVDRDPNNNCAFRQCPSDLSCSQEVMECPDGSDVGRDPDNNCEFFPCPGCSEAWLCFLIGSCCENGVLGASVVFAFSLCGL